MRYMVIDLGSYYVKVSLYSVTMTQDKKNGVNAIERVSFVYGHIFRNLSDNILLLELNRILNEVGRNIDKFIFRLSSMKNECDKVENEIDQKVLRNKLIKASTTKEAVANVVFEETDANLNYLRVLKSSVVMSEYNRLMKIIKTLRLIDVALVSNITPLKEAVLGNGSYVVCDIGESNQSFVAIRNGVVVDTESISAGMQNFDIQLKKTRPEHELYSIKHNATIHELVALKLGFEMQFLTLNEKLQNFILKNKLGDNTRILYLGGYAGKDLGKYFKFMEDCEYMPDSTFANADKIPLKYYKYFLPSICSLYYYINHEYENIDFLGNKKDLAILTSKFEVFNKKTSNLQALIIAALLLNISFSVPLVKNVDDRTASLSAVNTVELEDAKKKVSLAQKILDEQKSSASASLVKFKLSDVITAVSAIKPDTVDIQTFEYCNNNLYLSLQTTDLDQASRFITELKTLFSYVDNRGPELVSKSPTVYKVSVICSKYKNVKR